jgi:hypothetical protein
MSSALNKTIFTLAIGVLYPAFLSSVFLLLVEDNNKHILSLIASMLTIGCSHYYIKNNIIKSGLVMGGALQLMGTLGYHWRSYDELLKISIYGLSLLMLTYYTYHFAANNTSITNIALIAAISALFCVFFFTLIGYCSDNVFDQESYKRFILMVVSVLSIIGSSFILRSTLRFGIVLGGASLLLMTFFLNWNYYSDIEKLIIYGVPLMLSLYGAYNQSSEESSFVKTIISLVIGVLYNLFIFTFFSMIISDGDTAYFILLALSIITMYCASAISKYLLRSGLLVGGFIMLIITIGCNFDRYSVEDVIIIFGLALATLLYFAYKQPTN